MFSIIQLKVQVFRKKIEMKKYIAKIGPLNDEKIACSPHETATFTEDEEQNTLHIVIKMFDTPASIEH